jgi:transposase
LNSKPHVVCDGAGKPLVVLLTEGRMSDHEGARADVEGAAGSQGYVADRGYDSNWFWDAPEERGTKPCITPAKSRKSPID